MFICHESVFFWIATYISYTIIQLLETVMSIEANEYARKRLFGKKVTFEELAKYVSIQLQGNPKNNVPKATQQEVASKLGYKDTKSIRQLIKLGESLGFYTESKEISKSQNKAFKFFNSVDAFETDPLVQAWVKAMRSRSRGGTEMKGWHGLLIKFRVICNTTKTNPEQWILGNNLTEVLDNGRELMTNFMAAYKEGKADIKKNQRWNIDKVNLESVAYSYSKAARDFMRSHGYNYPEGESGVMSQSISSFHGNYADVRLTEEQYEKGKEFIKTKYGLDSDVFRWFGIGIEAVPRSKAIFNMPSKFSTFQNSKEETFFIMEATETKTEHYKKGKWVKYIYSKDLQESIALVSKRSNFLIEDRSYSSINKKLYKQLKEVYKFLKVDKLHLLNANDPESGYFMNHPSHALRHAGAQLWLLKTRWNIVFVAKMGWKKSDELIESYGEMPPEIALKVLDEV